MDKSPPQHMTPDNILAPDLPTAPCAKARAHNDLGARRAHCLDLLARDDWMFRLASALPPGRRGLDGADVAVELGRETLHDEAVLSFEAAAEGVNEPGAGGSGKRADRLHGEVSVLPVIRNGGSAGLPSAGRRLASGQPPAPSGAGRMRRGKIPGL